MKRSLFAELRRRNVLRAAVLSIDLGLDPDFDYRRDDSRVQAFANFA